MKREDVMRHPARSVMGYLLVPILVLMCMPNSGSSSDVKGNYVALGLGLESCQSFLQIGATRPRVGGTPATRTCRMQGLNPGAVATVVSDSYSATHWGRMAGIVHSAVQVDQPGSRALGRSGPVCAPIVAGDGFTVGVFVLAWY